LTQEYVFFYRPNPSPCPSPFPTSLDLFRCRSASYADQVQHRILQLTQEYVSLLCPNPSPPLGLFQHRSTPFNPADHVQHHILQLMQEYVFRCHPVLRAQLLSTPFDPMLITFSIVFSNRCKKLQPLSAIDGCSYFPFSLLYVANLLFSSVFSPHTATRVSYEDYDRVTVHLEEIQVSIYLLPSPTPRCQRFSLTSQLLRPPPSHPKPRALELIKPLVDDSTILQQDRSLTWSRSHRVRGLGVTKVVRGCMWDWEFSLHSRLLVFPT
jgi:hypothetical protein